MIEREHADVSVVQQTELLGLDRSGVYYVPVAVSAEELRSSIRLMNCIHAGRSTGRARSPMSWESIARPRNDTCARWALRGYVLGQT